MPFVSVQRLILALWVPCLLLSTAATHADERHVGLWSGLVTVDAVSEPASARPECETMISSVCEMINSMSSIPSPSG